MIEYRLTGIDGTTVWEFSNPSSPLCLGTDPNVGGAPMANQRISNVYQAGGTWVGRNMEVAPLELDVMLKRRLVDPWPTDPVALWAMWRDSLGLGENLCTWEVESDHGGIRRQLVRLEEVTRESPLKLIESTKSFRERVRMASDESWYRKDELEATFLAADWATADITNLGDIEAPLRYEVTGPVTDLELGVNGEVVELTGTTIPAGMVWTIETDPESPRIIETVSGDNVWPEVHSNAGAPRSWHKLVKSRWDAPGATPIHIAGTGTTGETSVKVYLPQLFARGA